MALTIIQLYATLTATADAAAAIDIPEEGSIIGVDWDLVMQQAAGAFLSDDSMQVQLSFLSTGAFTNNDARGVVSSCSLAANTLATSGLITPVIQKYVGFLEGLQVSGGERMYLHALSSGAANTAAKCLIHLKVRQTVRRSRRRR